MRNAILLGSFLFLVCFNVVAQTTYPVIGKHCPSFTLENLENPEIKNISLASLKGRFFIIDFFSLGCSSCFASFPNVNTISNRFKDSLSIFVVGYKFGNVKQVFADYAKQFSLGLQSFYSKSIFEQYRILGVPYVVWVDDRGVVVAVSSSEDITEDNVRRFISHAPFKFWDRSYNADVKRSKSKLDRPIYVGRNGGSDTAFQYRTIISQSKPTDAFIHYGSFEGAIRSPFQMPGKKAYQAFTINLLSLYCLAYTGFCTWGTITRDNEDSTLKNIYPNPILLTKDSLKFRPNVATGQGEYNYSMIIPAERATPKIMMRILQNDLNSYFGYDAKIEKARIPYYAIVIDSSTLRRLHTKGGKPATMVSFSHLTFINQTIEESLEYMLKSRFDSEHLIYNKTNYDERIDFDGDFVATDFFKTKEILDSMGIHLLPRDTFINAIIIRDPGNN